MTEQNWWDDRTMPNDEGPDWERDADGVLWAVDQRTGHRTRYSPAPESLCYLRYRRDDPKAVPEGVKFASIRYPWKRNVTREQAEKMRQSMPDPNKFEIVEVGQ